MKSQECYKKLEMILRAACHAKDCNHSFQCPNQCPCKLKRTFKLNTETAMCWILADMICASNIYRSRRSKKSKKEIIYSAYSYYMISRYHMSNGWIKFFSRVHHILNLLIIENQTNYSVYCRIPNQLQKLKNSIYRLKREKK